MWYAIICEDTENSLEKRLQVRPAHLEQLYKLRDQGRLLVAGPHPAIDSVDSASAGFTGSLIIAEFDNLDSAQQWADQDPYLQAGVYAKVAVKPFKKVLP
jgi:uncharacterized protein YciI